MKFIHLSDLHLGKSVNEFSLIKDQEYILQEILEVIEKESVDAVLIAGDIYDRAVPSEEAVRLFDEFLTTLSKRKKKVFIISGNHDSDERLNYGSRLFQINEIFISGKYKGELVCVDVQDEYGILHVWMMPYIKASHVAHYYPKEDTSTYDAAIRTVIKNCEINREERNIILVHQFVAGKNGDPELSGSENAVLNIGTIDKISADCFADFDYVALGHIHSAQCVGRETIRYAGSPLKYSLNQREILSEKSVPVITMEEKGKVEVTLCPLKPMREVRKIKGELKTLIENAVDTEDYIYATLTDEEFQFDAMARLREVYPNIMKMDYDNATTRAMQENETDISTEEKSFKELVEEFYQLLNGRMPNEKEWKLIEEEAKEAGILE